MDILDLKPGAPGGRAGGGGCIHMSFRSGSRASGACAGAAHDYVTRTDEYADRGLDESLYSESGNMPSWAEAEPAEFWDAADLYERANGRLYVSGDFALPLGLDRDEQVALAREFVEELTGKERLPYTMAIHAGRNADGVEHNPHVHLMFSERRNDGIERSPKDFFRRANSAHPDRGGAPKSRDFHGREWVENARANWAEMTNRTLERLGRDDRVDHRSYARRGIDLEPGQHYGPAAPHVVGRDGTHDRLDDALAASSDEKTITDLDREIAHLESIRDSIERYGLPEERDYAHLSGPGRGGDQSWER